MTTGIARFGRSTICCAVMAMAFASLAASAGCEAEVAPPVVGGYSTVYADNVPPDIYTYPHVWFSSGYAYMVGDNWYLPNRGRWVRLQREPVELHRYRAQYGYARPLPGAAPPAARAVPAFPANRAPAPVQRMR
jgi:hypothetical protein